MEWVANLAGQTVFIDTAPLIYFIEEHETYGSIVTPLFEAADKGQIELVTSVISLLEVLVHPLRNDDEHLAQRYNDILMSAPHLTMLSITAQVAQHAAELRATQNLKTPDAIQLATALDQGTSALITNDRDFGVSVDNLQIIQLTQLLG